MRDRVGTVVFILAGLWIAALMQRGLPLAPDEIEFFRATRWIAEGRTPFAGFWEHHTPLQWLLFAPVALFADGAGVGSILLMRWAQLPLWLGIGWLIVTLTRRAGVGREGWWVALVLLVLSPTFVQRAIEYRVDVPGNLFFAGGLFAIAFGATPRRWLAFGALMSLALLANMRLGPLIVFTGALAMFWRPDERRWGWNPRGMWMGGGIAVVALSFYGYLAATGATQGFVENVIGFNRQYVEVLRVWTFWDMLLVPLWTLDLAGVVFWVAGGAGLVLALRVVREAGPLQFVAIVVLAGIVAVATMHVQYDYHFQNTWLLLLPFTALAIERLPRPSWRHLAVAAGVVSMFIDVARTTPAFGEAIEYQDAVMTGVDRLTLPGETVFEGGGHALRREPAWRYWFLTTGVRFLAARRVIEPYDVPQMAANPPAAVVADYRLILYLQLFPRLRAHALRHYLPVYRNLWVPGMTALVDRSPRRYVWTSPRAGLYEVYASDLLAKHPWFRRPLEVVTTIGPRAATLEIPLDRLPPYEAGSLRWIVDGVPVPEGTRSLRLEKGSRVELIGSAPAEAGVLLVPQGISTLCMAPEVEAVF